jgi:nitrogenase molybdenum-iron protein alpha/beta subunit
MEQGNVKETAGPSASSSETCTDPYLRCAFNGAALTALGVSYSALLAHSPQGCEYLVNNAFASQECDYMETMTLCTKLCVNEIVYGGEDILARTIREVKDLPISPCSCLVHVAPKSWATIL